MPFTRLLYGCIILALLPLLLLCFYNQPFQDDYWNGTMGRDMGLWLAQDHLYRNWSGRFSTNAALIVLNPLSYGWLEGVRFTAALFFGARIAILAFAVRSLSSRTISWKGAFGVAVGLVSIYMAAVPDKYATIYFFTCLMVYQLPAMTLLLAGVGADASHRATAPRARTRWLAVTALAVILTTAGNEMMLVLMGWSLLAGFIGCWWQKGYAASWRWRLWLLVWAATAALAIFAPGNFARVRVQSTLLLPVRSLSELCLQMVRQLKFELADPAGIILLAVPIILVPLGIHLLPGRPPGLRFPLWVGAAFIMGGLILGALPFNLLNYELERPVNVLYWWLLLGWVVACWASLPKSGSVPAANRSVQRMVTSAVVMLILVNAGRAWVELFIDAPEYARQWQLRYNTVQAAPRHRQIQLLPIMNVTPRHVLIRGYDLFPRNNHINNTRMAAWWGVDSIRLDPTQMHRAAY